MKQETAVTAVVGVLCILALSVAAASIDAPTASVAGGGGGDGDSVGTVPTPTPTTPANETSPRNGAKGVSVENVLQPDFCVPALGNPLVLVAIFALVAGGIGWFARRADFTDSVVALALFAGAPAIFLVFALWFTLTGCQLPVRAAQNANQTVNRSQIPAGNGTTGVGPGEATGPTAPETSMLMIALVAVALVAAVAVIVRGSGDDVVERSDEEEGPLVGVPTTSEIAEVAGDAADRIEESGDVGNEVYRAWREMTALLDVERPASSTPAEFREAAVAAGMAPADVDALTRLFEEVRYGGAAATAERERRAVEALRRIEEAYGGEDR